MAIYNKESVRGVIVTLQGGPPYDFLSRYFAPWNGVPEDPVTGQEEGPSHKLLFCSSILGDPHVSPS